MILGKMSLHKLEAILFLCCILLGIGDSANILGIFTVEAKSHFFFDLAIMKALADSGHNITMICPYPEVVPSNNMKVIDYRINSTSKPKSSFANPDFLKTSRLKHWQNSYKRLIQDCKDFTNSPKIQKRGQLTQYTSMYLQYGGTFHHLLHWDLSVKDLLSSEDTKFDIMFVHMLYMHECYLPIATKYKIPVIGTVSFRQFISIDEAVGNPHHLTIPFNSFTNPKVMTFFQRLQNIFYHLLVKAFYDFEISAAVEEFLKQFYPAFVKSEAARISLLFSNNHPSILSKPLAANVIEIGGIHIPKVKPLPEELENFINSSKDGVILLSLGSIADHEMVNEQVQQIFRDTFAEIPQRVIWKFGKPIANLTDNVYIAKWLPQFDILAHQNVKAFISHCGISGTYEAIYTSTPMILLPLFGDQPANAVLLQEMEVGVHVDYRTLSKEILLKAIHSIIQEEKYFRNMDHLSQIFKDQPMSPKESVVYWTNYILRHKGAHHLNAGIKNIPLYQYLLLDILLFSMFMIIMSFYIIKISCKICNSKRQAR